MNLEIISTDKELPKLFQEILDDVTTRPWTLSIGVPGEPQGEADLFVIDYEPGLAVPRSLEGDLSRRVYLVHRNEVPSFREAIGTAKAHILLKPATRATLGAFIGFVAAANDAGGSAARSPLHDADRILQCVIDANLRLQEYDQRRTNLLARAAHDFRTPLTALNGYCSLLLSEPLGALNDDQKEVLLRMQHSSNRLSRMAAALCQLSVGRFHQPEPDLQPCDLREIVEQALHEVAQFTEVKRIKLGVTVSIESKQVLCERDQIEQVLINLLDNACKFAQKGGRIEVLAYPFYWERYGSTVSTPFTFDTHDRLSREPNSMRVDVEDSGPAIPDQDLDRIFQEHTPCIGSKDRSGGGLGLAICRMIITNHGGQVWAENTASGPRFSFTWIMRTIARGRRLMA